MTMLGGIYERLANRKEVSSAAEDIEFISEAYQAEEVGDDTAEEYVDSVMSEEDIDLSSITLEDIAIMLDSDDMDDCSDESVYDDEDSDISSDDFEDEDLMTLQNECALDFGEELAIFESRSEEADRSVEQAIFL